MTPRVLVAPDKFKGTFTACEIAGALERALAPHALVTALPIADGGEGTADVFVRAGRAEWRHVHTWDARGRPCKAAYACNTQSGIAYIESAAVIGLAMLPADLRDPLQTTSTGLAPLIRDALSAGAREIVVGLGGTATNDLGCGVASEFGWRFLDEDGRDVRPCGAGLGHTRRVVPPDKLPDFRIVGLTDVRNPLLGPRGAARAFSTQKGATPEGVSFLEDAARTLVALLPSCDPDLPGAGAAGGLGFGLATFFNAELRPGVETIFELFDMERAVAEADVVVTGEGRFDATSLLGKGPMEVSRMARAAGKPCVLLCGSAEDCAREMFDAVIELQPSGIPDVIARDEAALQAAAERVAVWIAAGRQPPAGRSR